MMSARWIAGPVLCALACALASPASAGLKLCNRTSYVLYSATGFTQDASAITQGWVRILPGTCQTAIKEPLTAKKYFVYARTSLAHSGTSRAWGGTQTLCVKDATFALRTPLTSSRCPADDTFELPFAEIDTHREKSWAMTFDESPAFRTLKDAENAGLKRLLRDQGAKVGAIDAKPDKAADGAMVVFDGPDARETQASSINKDGTVAGTCYRKHTAHGFIRTADGTFTSFDAPGSRYTRAFSINDNGVVAGQTDTMGFIRRP